ncbi:hypothetical protein [Paenibacillus sp. DMB20]|uniref:hypothetical protein n=1 Tax=Paenibacillus sp. DMB20 TaxID=1642570 RepID=UPI0006280226|nr:hypothetical protein [Paenibacillus sp. DMB20]
MLYGFPGRSHPAQRGEPTEGGVHGGELNMLDREGKAWAIRRFAGSAEGSQAGRGERLTVTVSDRNGGGP